jgi:hypothetical protein
MNDQYTLDTASTDAPDDASPGYPSVYRQLMAVGLLGTCYRAGEDATVINDAVEATLADTSAFRIYRALVQGISGDPALAAEEVLQRHERGEDNDRSKIALAMSLMLAGDPDWKPLVENVLAVSTDQLAREAATELVQYLVSMA